MRISTEVKVIMRIYNEIIYNGTESYRCISEIDTRGG